MTDFVDNDLSEYISAIEFKTYKAILKNPPINISKLAQLLNINRTTLYLVLTSLEKKGLIKNVKGKEAKIKYRAMSPYKLLDFVDKRRKEILSNFEKIRQQIPYLYSLLKLEEKFKYIVFKGPNSLCDIKKILATSTEFLTGFTFNSIINLNDYIPIDDNGELIENDNYIKTILKYGDFFVFPGDDKSIAKVRDVLSKFPHLEGKFEPRWVDKSELNLNLNLFAFDDIVIFYTGRNKSLSGYAIKNKELASSFRSLSLFIWKNANPIS